MHLPRGIGTDATECSAMMMMLLAKRLPLASIFTLNHHPHSKYKKHKTPQDRSHSSNQFPVKMCVLISHPHSMT